MEHFRSAFEAFAVEAELLLDQLPPGLARHEGFVADVTEHELVAGPNRPQGHKDHLVVIARKHGDVRLAAVIQERGKQEHGRAAHSEGLVQVRVDEVVLRVCAVQFLLLLLRYCLLALSTEQYPHILLRVRL